MILLVLVAHDGKTLQLDVSSQTRVDAVQQALVSVTGISVSDQIVMCHGARLDPAKPLAAYKLPVADVSAAEDTPVFLYHKLYLRPGAAPPPQEQLPVYEVTVPGLPHVGLRHPLHSAHSPLIRALPDYEAQFSQQLGEARAYWEASQQRLHKCRQLMSEQEVQARAADAARANVESHYNYIASIYATFVDKYVSQHQQHTALLSQAGELSAALSSVALPQQLQTQQWKVLADLQPRVKLTEWHESCSRSHEHFAQKVIELEGVFQLLRCDVERLFLQAPCVDLDALGQQLGEAEGMVEEQGSIVQVLTKDLATVQGLVESVVAQLGSSAGGASLSGAAVHDSCAAVDTLLEQHLHSLLPRVRALDTAVAEFLLRCAEAKACMTRDVLEQLQGIAAQQSRIRDMKHKLALLNEVLSRQAAAFAELQAANRLPAAYRLALAECARRAAWREMYAAQAARLAEHCGRITTKEAAKREAVNRQLERHLPHDLLAAAGLLTEPPHCTVSLPPGDAMLLPVTTQDITKLPAAIQAAADAAAVPPAERRPSQPGDGSIPTAAAAAGSSSIRVARGSSDGSGPAAAGASSSNPRSAISTAAVTARSVAPSMLASTWLPRGSTAAAADPAASAMMVGAVPAAAAAAAAAGSSGLGDLSVENARLRAELAGLLAQQAAKELGEGLAAAATVGPSATTADAAAAGSGSTLLASSVSAAGAASSMALGAPTPTATGGQVGKSAAAARQRPYGHGGVPAVPASVTASLPSVSAALQQVQQQQEEAATAAASQQALTLGPVKVALAAKDELISVLELRVTNLSAELSSYESRITALEAQLAAAATATASAATASVAGRPAHAQDQSRASSSANQPHGQAMPQQQLQQQEEVKPPSAGQESVAPAFLLDATQGTSFFAQGTTVPAAVAAGTDGSQPPSRPAATATVVAMKGSVSERTDLQGQGQQQQQQQKQQQQQEQQCSDVSVVVPVPAQQPGTGDQPLSATEEATADAPTAADAAAAAADVDAGVSAVSESVVNESLEQQQKQQDSAMQHAATDQAQPQQLQGQTPSGSSTTAAAATAPPLSVSEPDLRGVLVAGPAEVEQAHRQEGAGTFSSRRLAHRGSLDSATVAAADTGAAATAGGGGIGGLLSSSMHYLFHRSGSSKGDSGSSGGSNGATGGTSTPVSSPPPGPSSP